MNYNIVYNLDESQIFEDMLTLAKTEATFSVVFPEASVEVPSAGLCPTLAHSSDSLLGWAMVDRV